jgi:uncharacterized protein
MSEGIPFLPPYTALPPVIPVFPLPGALLLPGMRLPLTIFEPRYLAMVDDALRSHRLIGMIQPVETAPAGAAAATVGHGALHTVGCAGKLTGWQETPDGRFLISLTGLIRFRVVEEVSGLRGYRMVKADWQSFRADWPGQPQSAATTSPGIGVDRTRLRMQLERFVHIRGLNADWAAFSEAPDAALVDRLAMGCPFAPAEKQALLEAPDIAARGHLLLRLLEMAGPEADDRPPLH